MRVAQVHIDTETLDVEATARLLSFGAVIGDAEFYVEIDQSLYPADDTFTSSKSTQEWWAKQGGFHPTTDELLSPAAAVAALCKFIDRETLQCNEWEVWANAPTFDCSILRHHMRVFVLGCPWMYWQERDVRTVKNLARQLRLSVRERENPHNALRDAKNQQALVHSVYNTLAVHLHRSRQSTASWTESVHEALAQEA